ncbi:MAG: hypothetical protein ACT4O3_10360, partial [Elusimicrobiota bacterium]
MVSIGGLFQAGLIEGDIAPSKVLEIYQNAGVAGLGSLSMKIGGTLFAKMKKAEAHSERLKTVQQHAFDKLSAEKQSEIQMKAREGHGMGLFDLGFRPKLIVSAVAANHFQKAVAAEARKIERQAMREAVKTGDAQQALPVLLALSSLTGARLDQSASESSHLFVQSLGDRIAARSKVHIIKTSDPDKFNSVLRRLTASDLVKLDLAGLADKATKRRVPGALIWSLRLAPMAAMFVIPGLGLVAGSAKIALQVGASFLSALALPQNLAQFGQGKKGGMAAQFLISGGLLAVPALRVFGMMGLAGALAKPIKTYLLDSEAFNKALSFVGIHPNTGSPFVLIAKAAADVQSAEDKIFEQALNEQLKSVPEESREMMREMMGNYLRQQTAAEQGFVVGTVGMVSAVRGGLGKAAEGISDAQILAVAAGPAFNQSQMNAIQGNYQYLAKKTAEAERKGDSAFGAYVATLTFEQLSKVGEVNLRQLTVNYNTLKLLAGDTGRDGLGTAMAPAALMSMTRQQVESISQKYRELDSFAAQNGEADFMESVSLARLADPTFNASEAWRDHVLQGATPAQAVGETPSSALAATPSGYSPYAQSNIAIFQRAVRLVFGVAPDDFDWRSVSSFDPSKPEAWGQKTAVVEANGRQTRLVWDGKMLMAVSGGKTRVYDLQAGHETLPLLAQLDFSADRMAVNEDASTVTFYDAAGNIGNSLSVIRRDGRVISVSRRQGLEEEPILRALDLMEQARLVGETVHEARLGQLLDQARRQSATVEGQTLSFDILRNAVLRETYDMSADRDPNGMISRNREVIRLALGGQAAAGLDVSILLDTKFIDMLNGALAEDGGFRKALAGRVDVTDLVNGAYNAAAPGGVGHRR